MFQQFIRDATTNNKLLFLRSLPHMLQGACKVMSTADADNGSVRFTSLTQTADSAVQADVVEICFGCLPVSDVLLAPVPHVEHFLLSIGSV